MSASLLDNRAEHYSTHGSVVVGNGSQTGTATAIAKRYLSQAEAEVQLNVDLQALFLVLQLSPAGAIDLATALMQAGVTAMEVNKELRVLRAAHWGQQP